MIIEMKFDSEYGPDMERLQKVFRALGLEGTRNVKTCTSIMETARRMNAGEQVIFHAEPKKRRGRPPKVKDIYTLAREKTAGRNA